MADHLKRFCGKSQKCRVCEKLCHNRLAIYRHTKKTGHNEYDSVQKKQMDMEQRKGQLVEPTEEMEDPVIEQIEEMEDQVIMDNGIINPEEEHHEEDHEVTSEQEEDSSDSDKDLMLNWLNKPIYLLINSDYMRKRVGKTNIEIQERTKRRLNHINGPWKIIIDQFHNENFHYNLAIICNLTTEEEFLLAVDVVVPSNNIYSTKKFVGMAVMFACHLHLSNLHLVCDAAPINLGGICEASDDFNNIHLHVPYSLDISHMKKFTTLCGRLPLNKKTVLDMDNIQSYADDVEDYIKRLVGFEYINKRTFISKSLNNIIVTAKRCLENANFDKFPVSLLSQMPIEKFKALFQHESSTNANEIGNNLRHIYKNFDRLRENIENSE